MRTPLLALLLLAGCSPEPTFVLATITRGDFPAATPIRGLQTTIMLDGRLAMTPMLEPSAGAEFALPATLTLEVGTGDGVALVAANAYGDGGALLTAGSTEVVLAPGDTTPVTIELGRHDGIDPDAAVDESVITITSGNGDFGTRTLETTRIETFTVGNSGNGPSQALDVELDGDGSLQLALDRDDCSGVSLAPGDTCTFDVSFHPTMVGSAGSTVEIRPYSDTAAAGLSGAGVMFSLTPSSVGFGTVATGATATQTVTVTNESDSAATQAIAMQITGTDADELTIDAAMSSCTSGQTLPPNTFCTVVVRFTPLTAGAKTAMLNVTDRATMSLAVTGTGM